MITKGKMDYSINGVGALKEKFNWIHISNYKLQMIKHLNVKKNHTQSSRRYHEIIAL